MDEFMLLDGNTFHVGAMEKECHENPFNVGLRHLHVHAMATVSSYATNNLQGKVTFLFCRL
jgi:hypothetical protein